jgi:hypothetical protein
MAIDDFWLNVEIASRSDFGSVSSDSPLFDSGHFQRRLRTAVSWLTPASVEGFDARDFTFLSPSEREKLTACVEGFREVAEKVPADGPATQEQEHEARSKLSCILEILRPDENPDVEAFRAAKVLENMRLPHDVRDDVDRILREFDSDSTGDPSVWVWVILKDEAAKGPKSFERAEQIKQFDDDTLFRHRVRLRPYIRFLTVSEQDELDRDERK